MSTLNICSQAIPAENRNGRNNTSTGTFSTYSASVGTTTPTASINYCFLNGIIKTDTNICFSGSYTGNTIFYGTTKATIVSGTTCLISPVICSSGAMYAACLGIGGAASATNKVNVACGNIAAGNNGSYFCTNLNGGGGYSAILSVDATGVKFGNNSGVRNLEFQTNSTTRMCISCTGSVGIGVTPTEALQVQGNIKTNGCVINNGIQSTGYTTGVLGNGYALRNCSGKYNLELDNLRVRGELNATTYNIQKIKASNGDIFVSAGVKAASGLTYSTTNHSWYIAAAQANENTFAANDIIKSQTLNGNNIYSNCYQVTNTNAEKIFIRAISGSSNYGNGGAAYVSHKLKNCNATTFSELFAANSGWYCVVYPASNTFIRTNTKFTGNTGTYCICGCAASVAGGQVCIAMYDCISNTQISYATPILFSCTGSFKFGGTLANDTCSNNAELRIYSNNVNLTCLNLCVYDYSLANKNVCNQDFIRLGNTTNTSRQGLIHLSASDTNAPYIEVRDGVNSLSHTTAQIKARLGKLNGLTFNNCSLAGYGLYSCNSYLIGGIVANNGCVGGWSITDDVLSSSGTTGKINLSSNSNISLTDTNGATRVTLAPANLTALSSLVGSSNLNWCGAYSAYATECCTVATGVNVSNVTRYLQQYTAANNQYIEAYATCQASKNFSISTGKVYTATFKLAVATEYTLPANDYDNTDYYTTINSIDGSYNICGTLTLYNNSNAVVLQKTFAANNLAPVDNYGNPTTITIFNNENLGVVNTTNVYYVLNYTITNYVANNEFVTVYQLVNGEYVEDGSYDGSTSIDTTFKVSILSASIDGIVGVTEITGQGIQSVWDSNAFFRINKTAAITDKFICSAGVWNHYAISGTPATFNYCCAVVTQPVVQLNHSAASGTAIKLLQASYGASCTAGGYVNLNITTKTLTFVSDSDRSLKYNIQDSDIDAVKIINCIPVRHYIYCDNDTANVGWIAQEVNEYYPEAVVFDESRNLYGIAPENFNVLYFKAIQQLTDRIKCLENKVRILENLSY